MSAPVEKVVVVEGLRTPFARAGKELSDFHPADLAVQNLRELMFRSHIPGEEIDEVILGNVDHPPDTANMARVVALRAGLPKHISAVTVSRNCASSLESVAVGTAKIQAGQAHTVIAGGVESMSQAPVLFSRDFQNLIAPVFQPTGFGKKLKTLLSLRLRFLKPRIGLQEALRDPVTGLSMGQTAEILAKEFHISRTAQDEFAMTSHQRALTAQDKLKEELFPVFAGPNFQVLDTDTGPRRLPAEKVSKFKPFFDRKYGTVTLYNSCPVNDGSSFVILMGEEKAKALSLKPLSRIRSLAFRGLEPERMGLGPVYAVPTALKQAGLTLKDVDLIEINEAFSAQVLACLKAMNCKKFAEEKLGLNSAVGEIDPDRLNVNGGAIALGHPVSATGTRLLLTLSKELKRRKAQFGLMALCIGGGQGGALVLENIS